MSEEITHFVWCALVAAEMARSDGRVRSREDEQHFIKKWLQQAQQKKLFCREIAPVLLALLKLESLYGASISLKDTLNYCWQLNTGSLGNQTDFYRLNCALTLLKLFDAQKFFLQGYKYHDDSRILSNKGMKIFIDKKNLSGAFDVGGNLRKPLTIKVEHEVSLVLSIMKKCCLNYTTDEGNVINLVVDM